ncbi:3-isopropylmalate dehydrogenase [Clostridium sporogenes]|uniref:3-isopropylmalate dehydrogenase n=1 Tax=Clostridium botulinum TaxID=1491 RepID=UPI000717571F|nr:3-isopropylmalate dehydrogenase [Clostridium botulinum]KRU26778.1 3-isopropylmalate dehydrogenase [Clostridium sporogenes]KRU29642.1 3-isopropylmalate dehydrogenase [Clostridium sporogenes]KRU35407.1 3-isopropylmalate dehydrogenase [Clostridium sporogenes]KRU49632.1 3-isopropylmalate dehydrogenase [Clostridium sporogenes]MBZ1328472.1 3-isopropylmalate dehydrogenase [Clostridium botulinum]
MKIALIPGDGIGPEVIEQTVRVLDTIEKKFGHSFKYTKVQAGGCSIDENGIPLTDKSLEVCQKSNAVLLGAVGGPKWDMLPGNLRPEQALLGLRKGLGVFANLRPAVLFPQLKNASTLRPEIIGEGIDILVVRELIGGIYFGPKSYKEMPDGSEEASDTEVYTTEEIKRIAHIAFKAAMKRQKKVCSVDKANILESSRLWRKVICEVAKQYPEVELNHLYVDNCAMQLIRDPRQFDVIVTSNMFGDILSDEASMLTGSLGMLPSASLGSSTIGIYEPIHGSALDIAGQDKANPIATIMSAAMMLRYSFGMEEEAKAIEKAVEDVLEEGYRTGDIMEEGKTLVGTRKMAEYIISKINC